MRESARAPVPDRAGLSRVPGCAVKKISKGMDVRASANENGQPVGGN